MKKVHFDWLEKNLQSVEKVAGFDTGFIPDESREAEVYQNFIEIFDSKESFDDAMKELPFLDKGESAFEFLEKKETAFVVEGKYIFVDYNMVDDFFPGRLTERGN